MKIPLYQVDAFAEELFRGNPAAVCPLEHWLPDEVLQAIAQENNLSETAFYVPEGEGFALRWFTPRSEVDLCGHATLAAAHVLFEKRAFAGKEVLFHTRSGVLKVGKEGERLILDFPAQRASPCETPDLLVEALGARPHAVCRALDYMAVYGEEEEVKSLAPDFRLLGQLDLRGVIVTAPGREVDFVSRFFAPKVGIDEDPVTGSAHCTLTPYWAGELGRPSLSARQLSPRTGSLQCLLEGERVLISGSVVSYLEGTITLASS